MSLNVDTTGEGQVSIEADTVPAGPSLRTQSRSQYVALLSARYGLLMVFGLVVVVFSLARPDTFPTMENLEAILTTAAPGLIVAMGLTVPLVMQEFDLSFAATVSLVGGAAVVLMSQNALAWPVVVVLMLAIGVLVGALNGFLIAFLGGSSFIVTLAMATVVAGVEFAITNQASIFSGVAPGYAKLGQGVLLGLGSPVWVAIALAVALWIMLDRTEVGRFMYAVGGNPEAARLSGLPNRGLKLAGFVIVAFTAATVGILLTASSGSYTPSFGASYLLPAFAGAFLGSAVWRPGEFTIPGTITGVLFLGVVQTGLTMLNLPTFVINLVQGSILIAAVLLSRVERGRA